MTTNHGFVVPAGGGTHFDMGAPGRFADAKLVGHETNESIMMFEETVPAGTKSAHRASTARAPQTRGESSPSAAVAGSVGPSL